jgi:hypothetical protein
MVTWLIGCVITELAFWRQKNYYWSIRLHLQPMRWAGYITRIREMKKSHRIIALNPKIKRQRRMSLSKREKNIQMGTEYRVWVCVCDRIHLTWIRISRELWWTW